MTHVEYWARAITTHTQNHTHYNTDEIMFDRDQPAPE